MSGIVYEYFSLTCLGLMAQLVERSLCKRKVPGPIPGESMTMFSCKKTELKDSNCLKKQRMIDMVFHIDLT